MKAHVLVNFPKNVDSRWLESLYSGIAHDRKRAEQAHEYYNNFYGGTRMIHLISFKIEESNA